MEAIQFLGVTPQNLIADLKDALIPELKNQLSKEFQPKEPTEYLTRNEVCGILKINLSTLYRWTRDGVLKSFGIQNRVYYKRSDIDELINNGKM